MKIILKLFLVSLGFFGNLMAQNCDVTAAFVNIPDEYYQTVNQEQRQLLINNYTAGDRDGIANQLRGRTRILDLRPETDWMRVQNSESASLEIKLLRINGQVRFNVLIFTACGPVCSSHVGLFDPNWNLLQVRIIPELTIEQFLDQEAVARSGKSLQTLIARFGFPMITYSFAEDGQTLSVELLSEELADEESKKTLSGFLATRRMTFVWDQSSGHFVKQ